jgi:hypothetical protein
MKYIIDVGMDNAAFSERPEYELGRILEDIAEKLITGGIYEGGLRDTNGNTVGSTRLEGEAVELQDGTWYDEADLHREGRWHERA